MYEKFVGSKDAICQLIQHSEVFQGMFRRNIERTMQDNAGVLRNLSAAKHRFESFQKPLGRAVTHFHALVLTNEQVANIRRRQRAGRAAVAFDAFVTCESALQLAMLADAGDENMVLVRFADAGEECAYEELTP